MSREYSPCSSVSMNGRCAFWEHRRNSRKTKYPGLAQLVARLLWEFAQQNNFYVIRESSRCGAMDTAAAFSNCGQNRIFWPQFCQLIIFDFSQLFCYNWFKYPGVAQLVAHLVWDQGVERSNRSTRTKKAVDFRIDGFFASLWDVKGFLLDWL